MTPTPVPEQGQLVEVRRRPWLVKDVYPGALDRSGTPHHRVTLESVEHTFGALELPRPREDQWDPLKRCLSGVWAWISLVGGIGGCSGLRIR